MKVRLFAALREIAGASEVEAEGTGVDQVVQTLGDRFGERFTAIALRSSFVVNGERVGLDAPLADDDEVALLPPVSGGVQ